MKNLILAELGELSGARLVCDSCNEATSLNVVALAIEGRHSVENCPNCGNAFHRDVLAHAKELYGFVKHYKKLKAEHRNGAKIWIEIENKKD